MNYSMRKYHISECISFKSTKGKYGSLSNMAPGFPIKLFEGQIKNAEILYQAFRFPEHPEIQRELLRFNSPITAKKYGRQFIELTRSDWFQYRFDIMRFCIAIKLENNFEIFSKILLDTEDKAIVEFSEKDKVWGASKHGDYYIGTNALGRLLMELRRNVKEGNEIYHNRPIPNLKLLNENINNIRKTMTNNR